MYQIEDIKNTILCGDSLVELKKIPTESIDAIITSPPYYGLRDYGVDGQIGLEPTYQEFINNLCAIFDEVKRVLKKEGVLFLNLGDSYNGNKTGNTETTKNPTRVTNSFKKEKSENLKEKDLVGIPWRVAFALQADGWYLRQDIIWAKPNPMPESVQGSHFYRHRVTIEKYEELQRVWKTKSINKDGASDLPNLSSGKVSDSETALHEKSKRNSNSKSERTTAGSKREAKPILGNDSGEIESREISGDSEWNGERTEASGELSGTTSESGRNRNGTGLDGHSGPPSLSLFLLQPEKFQNDSRPQNPVEQRREKLAREHSASLPQVQLHKEGQNRVDAEEVDCPGCYMCENQNGFIFTLSAGRCTKSHEYIFLLSKSPKYFFDNEAIKENTLTQDDTNRDRDITRLNNTPGRTKMAGLKTNNYEKRNKRSVWTITTKPFKEAHFATFPEDLIVPMVKAGCPKDGIVLDPFMGAGTTALVAKKLDRNFVGIELNPEYIKIAEARLKTIQQKLL